MSKGYWQGRWQRGETGWHQTEVEPALIAHLGGLPKTRVLVPLCGKTLDMTWLAAQGHEVIGVELSELACEAFFKEHGLKYEVSNEGSYRVFRSGPYTIYCGDFFELKPALLGKIGAVYDRAALIALPPEVRERYVGHMLGLIGECATPGFSMLQIVLEREPHDGKGPPYSVPSHEIRARYQSALEIAPLSREQVEIGPPTEAITHECVYRMSRLAGS